MKWAVAIVASPIAIGMSYLMALAGEPSSAWLWRDILGLLP